jgi:hypothetical protein
MRTKFFSYTIKFLLYCLFVGSQTGFNSGNDLGYRRTYSDEEYFSDEDGFGVEPNSEVNVYAYIDENCRVLVPFTYMENREKREEYFEKAVKKVNGE